MSRGDGYRGDRRSQKRHRAPRPPRFGYYYRGGQWHRFAKSGPIGDRYSVTATVLGVVVAVFLWVVLPGCLPMGWAVVGMNGIVVVGGALFLIYLERNLSFATFFEWLALIMLWLSGKTIEAEVTERVEIQNTDHLRAIGIGIGILVAVLVFWWASRRKERSSLFWRVGGALVVCFLVFGWSVSVLLGADVLLDRGDPRQTTAQVVRLENEYRNTGGRWTSHWYMVYFAVVEENDLTEAGRFPVDKTLYDSLEPGDQVLLTLHSGALGAPWVECSSEEK